MARRVASDKACQRLVDDQKQAGLKEELELRGRPQIGGMPRRANVQTEQARAFAPSLAQPLQSQPAPLAEKKTQDRSRSQARHELHVFYRKASDQEGLRRQPHPGIGIRTLGRFRGRHTPVPSGSPKQQQQGRPDT